MRLPIRAFWLFANSVPRIAAEDEMRSLHTAIAAQAGQEGVKQYTDSLEKSLGTVVVKHFDPRMNMERDEEGIAFLKSLV